MDPQDQELCDALLQFIQNFGDPLTAASAVVLFAAMRPDVASGAIRLALMRLLDSRKVLLSSNGWTLSVALSES